MEAFEDSRQLMLGNAASGIADLELDMIAEPTEAHADLAREGELVSIREQIQDNLLPVRRIHVHGLGQRRALHRQTQARAVDERAE
jgi:hypothetical protein